MLRLPAPYCKLPYNLTPPPSPPACNLSSQEQFSQSYLRCCPLGLVLKNLPRIKHNSIFRFWLFFKSTESSPVFMLRINSGQKTSPFCGCIAFDTRYLQGKADPECPMERENESPSVVSWSVLRRVMMEPEGKETSAGVQACRQPRQFCFQSLRREWYSQMIPGPWPLGKAVARKSDSSTWPRNSNPGDGDVYLFLDTHRTLPTMLHSANAFIQ